MSTNRAEHYKLLLKLLFSVNCQTTAAYRAIHNFHFHHSWVRHVVNYVIPPHMWVCHTVRNVGLPHSDESATFITLSSYLSPLLESCQQWKLTFLLTVAFRATKLLTTLTVDVPVAIRATKNLEDTMLPINYQS